MLVYKYSLISRFGFSIHWLTGLLCTVSICSSKLNALSGCSDGAQRRGDYPLPRHLTMLAHASLDKLIYLVLLALVPTAQPVNLGYPPRNTLAAPIRPSHGAQRHKRSRMLTRKPDAPLRATLPQRLNVLIQLHLSILHWIARLKRRVRAEPCKLIVLPVRGNDRRRGAVGRRGGVSR